MSNRYGKSSSNFFPVTNESRFRAIMDACMGNEKVHVIEDKQPDGSVKFSFYCNGSIYGLPYKIVDETPIVTLNLRRCDDELEYDVCWDLLCKALQSVLPDGDAIIVTEVGSEAMRYFVSYSVVITKYDIQSVELRDRTIELARAMLGDTTFDM